MKLVFILEDEAWFWIWNEETLLWEAWYENGEQPAVRLEYSDRATEDAVAGIMAHMAHQVVFAADVHV